MSRRAFPTSLLALPLTAQPQPRVKAAFLGLQHSPAFDKLRLVQGDIDELAAALLDSKPMLVSLDQELAVQETLLRTSLMLP